MNLLLAQSVSSSFRLPDEKSLQTTDFLLQSSSAGLVKTTGLTAELTLRSLYWLGYVACSPTLGFSAIYLGASPGLSSVYE